jgi:hypothetical protein
MKLDTALRLSRAAIDARPARPLSFFEFWPGWLFYAPVVAHWIALGLRHGDLSLPTAANPHITAGGLCGESKLEILDQVGPAARHLIAPYVSIVTHATDLDADLAAADLALAAAALSYPVVAKPDIGCNGTGVRLIRDRIDLGCYLRGFPRGERAMLQRYVSEPGEAGVFYIRRPGEATGRITSITLKHVPTVVGDGRSTLRQLILADPRASRVPQLYLPRLADRLHLVPRRGETVRLVFVGNHCKGSIFENATALATGELLAAVERVARAMPDFHFGRIDLRFASLSALLRGEDFRIIEINGVGSEATHIWDPATRLLDAWRTQFMHYGQAFRIGAANRRSGHRPAGVVTMFRLWRRQKRLMAAYPTND